MRLKLKSYRILMTPNKCEKENDKFKLERENFLFRCVARKVLVSKNGRFYL